MTRTILSSLAIAVVLSTSAAFPAASQILADDMLISSYQTGGSSAAAATKRINSRNAAQRRVQPRAAGPGGLTGKQKALGAGMIVPAILGIVRAPSKKRGTSKPDTSKDDCMACD